MRDGQHGRIEGGHAAGDHRLQRHHHLAGDGDGVDGVMWLRCMAAFALDREFDAVSGSEQGTRLAGEHARLDVRRDVKREGSIRNRIDQAIIEHVAGAMPAFLTRLEHELHRSGEPVALGAKGVGRGDQHRDMRVVAAGVHRVLDLRGKFEAGVFVHRQRVHVAAQEDGAAVGGAAQGGDEAGGGGAFGIFKRQAGECGLRLCSRERIVQPDLGLCVDGAAQADHLGQQRVGGVDPVFHGFRHYGRPLRWETIGQSGAVGNYRLSASAIAASRIGFIRA